MAERSNDTIARYDSSGTSDRGSALIVGESEKSRVQDLDEGNIHTIRQRIARTEARMAESLSALKEKVSVNHLKERTRGMVGKTMDGRAGKMLDTVKDKSMDMGSSAAEFMKDNKISMALVGLGITYFVLQNVRSSSEKLKATEWRSSLDDEFVGREQPDDVGFDYGNSKYSETRRYEGEGKRYGKVREAVGGSAERLKEKAAVAQEKAHEVAEQVKDRAKHLRDDVQQQTHRAKGGFASLFQNRPLSLGVGAIALGMAASLLLPKSDREDAFLGRTREKLGRKAGNLGQEAADRVEHVAREAGRAARKEAERQGIMS